MRKFWALAFSAWFVVGCYRSAPVSQFPTAGALLTRLNAHQACSRGLTSTAKLDYFGELGRMRASLFYIVHVPDRVRLDLISPFGISLSTLTSDGKQFSLLDLKNRQLLHGKANACNLARFTNVPLPPSVLVQLLRGEAPVLVHAPPSISLAWEHGRYVVRVQSKHSATEKIELLLHPDDFDRPYAEQRLRLSSVEVEQAGALLYSVEMLGHHAIRQSQPRVDADGLDAPVPPSGPDCQAEIPERIRFQLPAKNRDFIVENLNTEHNPPLVGSEFEQNHVSGVAVQQVSCE